VSAPRRSPRLSSQQSRWRVKEGRRPVKLQRRRKPGQSLSLRPRAFKASTTARTSCARRAGPPSSASPASTTQSPLKPTTATNRFPSESTTQSSQSIAMVVSAHRVPARVQRAYLWEGGERSDVAPAESPGHEGYAVRGLRLRLHHPVVDADGLERREVRPRVSPSWTFGRLPLERLQHRIGRGRRKMPAFQE